MRGQLSIPGVPRAMLATGPQSGAGSWDGQPVSSFGCRFADLGLFLPVFRREPFVAPAAGTPNPYLDVIVREPDAFWLEPVPVNVVSKQYRLVQHAEALGAVGAALDARGMCPDSLPVTVTMTELGSRVSCSIRLPETLGFDETPSRHMALTIECFNSVDRTAAFRVLVGWFRLVCTNGLFVFSAREELRWAHTASLRLDEVGEALTWGLHAAAHDRRRWSRWQQAGISRQEIAAWADRHVRPAWGRQAAARLVHIARTGHDAHVRFPSHNGSGAKTAPTRVFSTVKVPGSEPPADTLYKVTQILAWLADRTGELDERMARRGAIPRLMATLMRGRSNALRSAVH